MLVVALLGLVLIWGFVRGNLSIRFGDVSVTTAVLAAWLLGAAVRCLREGRSVALRAAAPAYAQPGAERAPLMPLIIEAVRARATVGEISDALRAEWGEYRPG